MLNSAVTAESYGCSVKLQKSTNRYNIIKKDKKD